MPLTMTARSGALRWTATAGTDRGLRYPANFDVLHLSDHPPLVAVADGMGDGAGSAAAGSTAMATFVAAVGQAAGRPWPDVLRAAMALAQREVRVAGRQLAELTGCTLTALLVDGEQAWIAHIGDSRVYRWRDGLLELLTTDHTMAWLGVVHGWYSAGAPEAAAARYHLTRYVGHPAMPEPDLLNLAVRPGDTFVVCTDGIADQVSYQRLATVLAPEVPLDLAVSTLLDDARAAGGRDNATLVTVRFDR